MMNAALSDEFELVERQIEQRPSSPAPPSFFRFALTVDNLCATTNRSIKISLVSGYFKSIDHDDLAIAARFLSGQVFSVQDRRSLNIGTATVVNAVSSVVAVTPKEFQAQKTIAGDLATATHHLFEQHVWPVRVSSLSLGDVYRAMETISCTPSTKLKTERLKDLLRLTTPLEAKYLVKMITGDLRIALQESLVEAAVAHRTSADVTDVQCANLLTGDIGLTAVLAKNGQLDQACFRLFHPLKFMQATNTDLSNVGRHLPERLIIEDQLGGERVQVHVGLDLPPVGTKAGIVHDGIRVALFSQALEDISDGFQDLIPALSSLLPDSAGVVASNGVVLDGVIIPMLDGETSSQGSFPNIFGPDHTVFAAHDLLCIAGRALFHEPLSIRAAALDEIDFDHSRTKRVTSRHIADPQMLPAELKAARARGSEGIVLKDPRAIYRPGRRSTEWLAVKEEAATLAVVVTAVEGRAKMPRQHPTYTLAVRASKDDPRLLEVGKANTGLSSQDSARLMEWFRKHMIPDEAHGTSCRVEPKIVVEVTFASIKSTRRYESGYALQMPRILRILSDRLTAEIDTLETVRRFAEARSN